MMKRKERYVHEFHVRTYLKQRGLNIQDLSGEDLMVELFGDHENTHRFRIIDPTFKPQTKWYHRIKSPLGLSSILSCRAVPVCHAWSDGVQR